MNRLHDYAGMTKKTEPVALECDRKSQILKIATDLFAQFGFNGVSTRKISEITGCNLASISYYFGGKDKLYLECLNTLDPKDLDEFREILKTPENRTDFEQKLLHFCESFCVFVSRNSSSTKLLINDVNSHTEARENNFLRPIVIRMEEFINEGVEAGIVHPEIDGKLVSRVFIQTMVSQVLFRSFKTYENISFKDFAKRLVRNCTGSFYVE